MSIKLKRGQEVIIFVHDDGRVEVEAVGFKGKSCKDATKDLEKALGKAGTPRWKPEARQSQRQALKR